MVTTSTQRVSQASLAFALYVAIGGLLSFAGWVWDVQRLTDWLGAGISIQPNAALCVLVAGLGLVLALLRLPRVAACCGVVVAAIALLTSFEWLTGWSLGIDAPLTFARPWGHALVVSPGRMGIPACLAFTLLGVGLVLSASPRNERRRYAPALGLVVFGVAVLSITGYIYGADPLFTVPRATAIALQTTTFVLAAACALIGLHPDQPPMRWLIDGGALGVIARRAVPILLVVPIVLGWLRLEGEQRGFYDTSFGTALLVLVLIGLLAVFLWHGLTLLAAQDAALHLSEARKQVAFDELRDSDRRKDEFLATLAHELRNPLAPIRNALAILRLRQSVNGDAQRHALDVIERQLQHLTRLVDDLLDLSRIQSGKVQLRREPVELERIVRAALEASRPLIEQNDHELRVQLPAEHIVVEGDAVRLAQVLCNLLNNAARYTPRGGHVTLEATRTGDQLVLSVRDDGIGIPAPMLSRVFDVFAQGDHALVRSRGGLGIGLSLVQQLVALHGGEVEARSAGVDQGAEFIVRLPLPKDPTDPSPARPPRADAADDSAAGRRVLVVDDNVDAAESLGDLLRLLGHEVRTAHDGNAAVREAAEWRPEVAILDLGLPGLDGYGAARAIRREHWGASMRLIALTGWGQDSDRRRSREAGFDHHLVKPVDVEGLVALFSSPLRRQAEDVVPAD